MVINALVIFQVIKHLKWSNIWSDERFPAVFTFEVFLCDYLKIVFCVKSNGIFHLSSSWYFPTWRTSDFRQKSNWRCTIYICGFHTFCYQKIRYNVNMSSWISSFQVYIVHKTKPLIFKSFMYSYRLSHFEILLKWVLYNSKLEFQLNDQYLNCQSWFCHFHKNL